MKKEALAGMHRDAVRKHRPGYIHVRLKYSHNNKCTVNALLWDQTVETIHNTHQERSAHVHLHGQRTTKRSHIQTAAAYVLVGETSRSSSATEIGQVSY